MVYRKNYYSKHTLKDLCGMTTSCIRDRDSLYRQYRECRYNEPDISKPTDMKENLFYRYHNHFMSAISQKVVMIDTGIYIYMYKEMLIIVIGVHKSNNLNILCEKVNKYISSYKQITSNICPTIVWCCLYVYIDAFYEMLNICIENSSKSIYHDIFIIGNVQNMVKDIKHVRRYTYISIEEERAKKNKYIILNGYGCKLNEVTLFGYCLEIMNRVENMQE